MSESIKKIFTIHSQNNIERKLVKLKKNISSENNTELQNYLVKSRNMKPLKRKKDTPFTFNKNNITKSTFYSKLESNSSTKYDNNNKYAVTEMSQTYYNNRKHDNDCILLSSLYNLPDYKRKTINYFLRPKNKSLSTARNNTIFLNGTQNISSIWQKKEEKSSSILCTSNNKNCESDISNNNNNKYINKKFFTNVNINTNTDNYKSFPQKEKYQNLEFFLKNKFYVDIEEKFNQHFMGRKFTHDNSVKNKIIELNQVSEFWGGVFDYSNPIINSTKYQYFAKLLREKKRINAMRKIFSNRNLKQARKYFNISEKKNTNKKIPKLYTLAEFIEKRKKEINKEKKLELMRRNKTEEQMKYYFNNFFIDQLL
jgi:hypothetical protein